MKFNKDRASKGNPGRVKARDVLQEDRGRWLYGFVTNLRVFTSI